MRSAICLAAILLGGAFFCPAPAQVDLAIQKNDISMLRNTGMNATCVTAVVHNDGAVNSGEFTLRIGVSAAGSIASTDLIVTGVPAGESISRTASFTGTDWACGWANADVGKTCPETSEGNNFAGKNDCPVAILPGTMRDEWIGVANPGLDAETVILTVNAPPDWVAHVNPSVVVLAPGEVVDALLHIGAPSSFVDYARVDVFGIFQDGTPGVMEWAFHMESAIPVRENTWGAVKALFTD